MTSASDIAYASALDLVELYRTRALSPAEAAGALLDRAEALQPRLNAFCVIDRDGALRAAREAERRWHDGAPLGPLDGVPVTIKDLVLMRGFPTRRGSRMIDPVPDTEDGPAVARLREAGAVILGKTTTPEFGWKAIGDSPLIGITRNPWNLERTPGGSSAGAAAACAAGIAPLHVGSDGAGSIRIPSAFTGIFGIKATFGRVPAHPASPMGLLSNVGPMTRSVRDAALMLNILARPDHRDPYSLPPERRMYLDGIEDGVEGWRIAYSPDLGYIPSPGHTRVDPEIAECVATAARRFEELGAHVEQVGPIFDSPREALLILWAAGAARVMAGFPQEKRRLAEPGLIEIAARGARIGAVEYVGADLARTALGARMAEFHQKYDLLLTPMMPVPALPVGQDLNSPAEAMWIDWSPFSYPFNMTRQPAASIPCGLTSAGLPIGLQIVGPLYAEDRVLRAARAFERTQSERRPPL
jgi:aspartyl-tRNA(Asn)/glutamyl-tRNA(Gln) amidotransferase subunit A